MQIFRDRRTKPYVCLQHEVIERLQSEDGIITLLSSPTRAEDKVKDDEGPANPCMPWGWGLRTSQPTCPGDNAQPTGQVNSGVQSPVDNRESNIKGQWEAAHLSQAKQAERMVTRSRVDLKAAEPDGNVAVPIPQIDRRRGDPQYIFGLISLFGMDMYKIAFWNGVLKGSYSRYHFDLYSVHIDKVKGTKSVTAVKNSAKQNRCKSFKAKLKCNSRYHGSWAMNICTRK